MTEQILMEIQIRNRKVRKALVTLITLEDKVSIYGD